MLVGPWAWIASGLFEKEVHIPCTENKMVSHDRDWSVSAEYNIMGNSEVGRCLEISLVNPYSFENSYNYSYLLCIMDIENYIY